MPEQQQFKKALSSIGNALRGFYFSHSVRAVLIVVFTIIAVLQIAQSSKDLLNGIEIYRSTVRMTATNKAFDNFFEAAQNLTFERAQTTAALNRSGPISDIDLNILHEYRNRSEYLLNTILKVSQSASPEQIAYFEKDLNSLKKLRTHLDGELSKPSKLRDPFIADSLFAEISDLLSRIENFLLLMIQVENDPKQRYAKLSLLKLHAFQLRNLIGRESFAIASILSGRKHLNFNTRTELFHLNRRIEFLWLAILNYDLRPDLHPGDTKKAADAFEREYFGNYRQTRDAVISGISGRRRTMTANQYLEAVAQSQDAAENLMYIASDETRLYSRQIADHAKRNFYFIIWQTAIVLILLVLAIVIISKRVIRPLKQMMGVLGKLRREEYEAEIPDIRYKDEFGSLNKGFSTFRDSLIEKKRTEQEREKLIIELRDAIANIKTLSGLLPICASCKKIRNDQGYWQQLESYLAEHSRADFSHGICPECAKELYPEYYKKKSEKET